MTNAVLVNRTTNSRVEFAVSHWTSIVNALETASSLSLLGCATVGGCSICAEDDSSKCGTCDEGRRLSDDKSACITGRDDGNGLSPGAIVGERIIVGYTSILLGFLW